MHRCLVSSRFRTVSLQFTRRSQQLYSQHMKRPVHSVEQCGMQNTEKSIPMRGKTHKDCGELTSRRNDSVLQSTTPPYKQNAQQLRQTCLLPVQREHSLVSTAMEWWQSCVVLATHERCSPFRGATCGLQNTMQADICLSCLWSRARQEGFSALFWSPCRHKRWQVCWKGVIFGHPWHTEGEWRWNVGPFSPRFFLDHPTVHFLMPWRWQHEFQNGFFWSMQSMADVVLLRIGVESFPSLQLEQCSDCPTTYLLGWSSKQLVVSSNCDASLFGFLTISNC